MAVVVVVVDVVVDMAVAVEAVVVTEAVEDLATKHSTIHHRKFIIVNILLSSCTPVPRRPTAPFNAHNPTRKISSGGFYMKTVNS